MSGRFVLQPLAAGFADWDGLLQLILRAFAFMEGRIDPPSSAQRLTAAGLAAKAAEERAVVAWLDGRLAGCAFLADRGDHAYLGKLAVDPDAQGQGIGKALVDWCEATARAAGTPRIDLQARVELTGNQALFARLGFVETGRTAHAGYDRPTSVTMSKVL